MAYVLIEYDMANGVPRRVVGEEDHATVFFRGDGGPEPVNVCVQLISAPDPTNGCPQGHVEVAVASPAHRYHGHLTVVEPADLGCAIAYVPNLDAQLRMCRALGARAPIPRNVSTAVLAMGMRHDR